MKKLLYGALQCTWGVLQTFLGLCVFAVNFREKHYNFHGAVVTEWNLKSSVSLGLFVFVEKSTGNVAENQSERLLVHEYGHTIQSLILGPLYLLIIGIPSILWAGETLIKSNSPRSNEHTRAAEFDTLRFNQRVPGLPFFRSFRKRECVSYYSFYTERWADYCGEKITKCRSMGDRFMKE